MSELDSANNPNRLGLPANWHGRGYIPHYDDRRQMQFVTYRLDDSLPSDVVQRLVEEVEDDECRRETLERYLDAGHGACVLRDPHVARAVIATWQHDNQVNYRLHAWVVMPNHVHVLFEPLGTVSVAKIVGAWKSITARVVLQDKRAEGLDRRLTEAAEGGRGPKKRRVWQPEYFDRFIRNERHYAATKEYIHQNPVVAGLVTNASDWNWSSVATLR